MVVQSTGVHDVGGVSYEDDSINWEDKKLEHWEKSIHGLSFECWKKGFFTVDEHRRAIEGLTQESYANLSYYQKWAAAIAQNSIARGLIEQADLDAVLGETKDEPDVK